MTTKKQNWFQRHFTVGGVITILTILITGIGTVYVFADDVKEDKAALKAHTKDGHPHTVIKMVDEQEIILTQLKEDLDKKLDQDVFNQYQESQRELEAQFQKQLFQQLERIEGKLP